MEHKIRLSVGLEKKNGETCFCRSPAVLARKIASGEIRGIRIHEDPEGLVPALEQHVANAIEHWRCVYSRRPQCTWEWEDVCEIALDLASGASRAQETRAA